MSEPVYIPPPTTKAEESWWTVPKTREDFEAAVQRELPRMVNSRIGRWLSTRQTLTEYEDNQ